MKVKRKLRKRDNVEATLAMLQCLLEALNEHALKGPISVDQHQPAQAEQIDTLIKEAARMTLPPP